MVTQIFPSKTPEAAYPDLLRMGHVFVTSMGQRAFVDGLYGALDLAFGGDGWYYVINKTDPRGRLFERVRFAKFDFEGVFEPNIYLSVNGEYEQWDEENFPGPVCCDSDRNGTLFFTDEHANKVVTLGIDGVVTNHWGEAGDGPGQLNAAGGIEWQPDGTLWVVSSRSSRVQQFTLDGEYIRGFGEKGSDPGQLDYPWGVSVDKFDGSVLVADWRNDRVQRFSPDGELLHVFDTLGPDKIPLKRPSDVTVDNHGDVYVCDRGNDRIVQFNHRGLFIETMIGDAPMNELGARRLLTNPDMLRWRDYIPDLDREKRFWRPTTVNVDEDFRVFVVDAARFRVQVYRKTFKELSPGQIDPVDTYTDPKIN